MVARVIRLAGCAVVRLLRATVDDVRYLFGLTGRSRDDDVIGQSMFDDIRWTSRCRAYRCRAIVWTAPTADEEAAIVADPLLGRFGDTTVGIATIDGVRCIVRDRDWFGWPDPPRFAFMARDGDRIIASADFHDWPCCWTPSPDAGQPTVMPTTFHSVSS